MTNELKNLLEKLRFEKERYICLQQESEKKLKKLQAGDIMEVMTSIETYNNPEKYGEELEQEIHMITGLISYIDFKIKVLNVNEYAS